MYSSLVLSAALMAPAAPIPQDSVPNASGPAPRVLALKADAEGAVRVVGTIPTKVTVTNTFFTIEQVVENGQTVQRQVQKQVEQDIVTSTYFNKTLGEFNGKFTTAGGDPLTLDEATNRVKNGATVLASADGKPVAKSWLKAVAPDTVVMVADGLSHAQVQWGNGDLPNTPMPALTMLGAGEGGKIQAPCTSAPLDANGGYNDVMMWEGRAGRIGGGRAIRAPIYYGQQPTEGKVVHKNLADLKFDAYDVTGKLIPRSEALKRLAAGGMVLVAGDNRLPDETYLKGFHNDVLVLVGSELVLPVVPVDQTKKKEPAPAAAPAAPIAKPVLRGGPAKVAPALGVDKKYAGRTGTSGRRCSP
jgi:hypothetical protein